jgi:hypothetical protein
MSITLRGSGEFMLADLPGLGAGDAALASANVGFAKERGVDCTFALEASKLFAKTGEENEHLTL